MLLLALTQPQMLERDDAACADALFVSYPGTRPGVNHLHSRLQLHPRFPRDSFVLGLDGVSMVGRRGGCTPMMHVMGSRGRARWVAASSLRAEQDAVPTPHSILVVTDAARSCCGPACALCGGHVRARGKGGGAVCDPPQEHWCCEWAHSRECVRAWGVVAAIGAAEGFGGVPFE